MPRGLANTGEDTKLAGKTAFVAVILLVCCLCRCNVLFCKIQARWSILVAALFGYLICKCYNPLQLTNDAKGGTTFFANLNMFDEV